ncbi:hypothetical protein ACC754_44890, partial [Rhizobium johnstonii]
IKKGDLLYQIEDARRIMVNSCAVAIAVQSTRSGLRARLERAQAYIGVRIGLASNAVIRI